MHAPVTHRDRGDEDPDLCDDCGTKLTWHEDGNAETGPQEPYLDCPKCRYEHEFPMLMCDQCGTEQRTVKTGVTNERFDPTGYYVLNCGHTIL